MFFPRLRRQAKWMFVFLALVFGVGFVAFGVGSSLPGTGIVDFLGGGDGSGLTSAGDARKDIEENPKDAQAHLALSRALQRDGQLDEAIPPLVEYTKLRPNDTDKLQELASLYTSQASRARAEAQAAQSEAAAAAGIASFQDSQELAEIFGNGDFDRAVQDEASARIQTASTLSTTALTNATATYEKLVKLERSDPDLWFLLASSAEQIGKNDVAIRGYGEYLKLSPDAAETAYVKERIKSLKSAQATSVEPGGVTRITR